MSPFFIYRTRRIYGGYWTRR